MRFRPCRCCHCRPRDASRVEIIRPSDYRVVARVTLDQGEAVIERRTSKLTGRVFYRYRFPGQRNGQPAMLRDVGEPGFKEKTPFPSRHVFFDVGHPSVGYAYMDGPITRIPVTEMLKWEDHKPKRPIHVIDFHVGYPETEDEAYALAP